MATAPSPSDSQLINYLVRMVVPLRREFGRSLDVAQFMRDPAYADSVLEDALASQDPRLREYAKYVQSRLLGARMSNPASAAPGSPAESRPARTPEPESSTEEALRAKVMKKYTDGLR